MLNRSLCSHNATSLFLQRSQTRLTIVAMAIMVAMLFMIGFASTSANSCVAQEPAASQDQQPDLKKAMKYHSALQRRPNPGYLYDRFYNTWLDTSSLEDLKEFLVKQAETSSATPDRLLLAFFYAKQGDDVEALQQFREALKTDPGNAATLYEKAVVEARTLDFETALTDLANATKANPSAEDAIKIAQLQGKLFVRNRQTEEAVKVWDALIKNNPDDAGLMEDVIELQIGEGMFEQAEALSEKLIQVTQDPFQKVVRRLRKGDILQRAGSRAKALQIYGDTLSQVGMDTWLEREILSQIEQLFRREDDLLGLSDHLAKLVQGDDKRIAIRKTHSKIQMELGSVEESLATFEKIIDLTPGDRENREAFVNLLIRAEKAERAVKQMESLVAQHAKDAELQVGLAELCHQISAADKSKAALDKFVELSGKTEYSYLRAARLFEKFEDKDNAQATYETVVKAFPDSDSAKETWAAFLFRVDKKDDAVAIWKSLAKDTDRAGLVRIARIVSTRKMNQVAMDMLLARYDELKLDSIYLGQLCNEAISLKKHEQAIPWATERVRLAKTANDVDSSLAPAVQIIVAAKQAETVVQELKNKANRNASETCLLTELMERVSLGEEADAILVQSLNASKTAETNEATQILARQQVRLARGRQDWLVAAKAARELLDLPGGRKSPNVRQLVDLYVRADDDESALQWIEEWKRLSPGSLLPWLSESSLLERAGKYKESISVLRRATQEFPDDSDLYAQLAQRYLNNGQTENAERIFWRQYEESEKLSDKLRWAERLAHTADNRGDIDKLIKNFTQRKKNNPKSIEPLLSIAQAHRVAGNYEERRVALLEATRLKKDNLSLLLEIARMEESEGDWEKAIETLERASLLDKTTGVKQNIARIYIQYGEAKKGLSRMLEVAGGANSTAQDIEKIASSIVKIEDWEQLRDFVSPHVARFPNDYRLKFLLAIATEELGLADEAQRQFLELLKVNQEFSDPALRIGGGSRSPLNFRTQMSYLKGTLPDSAIEFMGLLTMGQDFAYSYRQSQNHRFSPYGGAASGTTAYLPADIKTCHQYSLGHLRELALELPEDSRRGLLSELTRAGVSDAGLILSDIDQSIIQQDPGALLEAHPDNETALSIAIMSLVRGEDDTSEKICQKGYEAFKDSYPALGFFAAARLDQSKQGNKEKLTEAINKLKSHGEPSIMVVQYIVSQTRGGGYGMPSDPANDRLAQHREDLNQLIADWYPKMSQDPQMSNWIFGQVVTSFRQEKSSKRFIQFLDEELVRSKKQKTGTSRYGFNFYSGFYGNRSEQTVALPEYPPANLIAFPSQVYAQLEMRSGENQLNPFGGRGQPGEESMTNEQIVEAISVAKHPTLKALLQLKYFRKQKNAGSSKAVAKGVIGDGIVDAKTAVKQLLKVSKTNVNAWYLSGALAVSEQRWDDASSDFETMRSLPLDAKTRRRIDGHLVALATQGLVGELDKESNKKVLESAKSAALRLRRGRLDQEQREVLVTVFETLGLNEAAKKMESRIANAANTGGSRSSGSATVAAPIERIKKLADAGKTDAASRLLAQEFQSIARQELNFDTMRQRSYQLEEFKTKVQNLSLTKEVLERLNPGASMSVRKLGILAVAQEVFSSKRSAEKTYEKLLETHPKEDEARLRYMLLRPGSSKQAFAEHFPKVTKRNRPRFLNTIVGSMAQQSMGAKDIVATMQAMIDYSSTNDKDLLDESLLGQLLSVSSSGHALKAGGYEHQTRSVYLPPQKASENSESSGVGVFKLIDKKKRAELEKLTKQQRVLHDRIARIMLEKPTVAGSGFTALLASTEAAGKPIDDELVQLAIKAAVPPKNTRVSPSSHYTMQMHSHMSFGYGFDEPEIQAVVKRTPVEFLARHFGLSGEAHDEKIESIATKLESAKDKDRAAKLRGTYALCRSSDDEFSAAVSKQIDAAKGTRRRPNGQKWQQTLSTVVEIWKERKLKSDISSFLIDYAARENTDRYGGSSINGVPYRDNGGLLKSYLKELVKSKDDSEVDNFMTALRLKMIGSDEEQIELSKQLSDQKFVGKNRNKVIPAGTYVLLASSLKSSRDTFWVGMKESGRFSFPNQNSNRDSYQILTRLSEFEKGEVDKLLQWLGESDVLEDLTNFDPYYLSDENSKASVWGEVYENFRYRVSSDLKGEISKKLSAKKKRTFGENFLMTVCEGTTVNIYDMLGSELKTFKALPADQRTNLARFANQVNEIAISKLGGRRGAGLKLSAEGKTAKSLCLNLLNKSTGSSVKKLMDASRVRDLGIEEHQFEDWSEKLIKSMSGSSSEDVLAAVSKISKLDRQILNNRRRPRSGSGLKFRSRLIEKSILQQVDMNSLKLILATFDKDEFADVTFSDQLSESFGVFFRKQFESNKSKMMAADKSLASHTGSLQAVQQLQEQLGNELGDRSLHCMIPELRKVFDPIKALNGRTVNKWIHSNEQTKYPKINASLRLAFDCSRDYLKQNNRRNKRGYKFQRRDKASKYLKEILSFVNDDSIPAQARFGVSKHLLDYDVVPVEGMFDFVKVFTEVIEAGGKVEEKLSDQIFDSLLGNKENARFEGEAGDFAKSWAKLIAPSQIRSSGPSFLSCVQVFVETDNGSEIKKMLSGDQERHNFELDVLLVESGYANEVVGRCRESLNKDDLVEYLESTKARFSSAFEAKLPELLSLFNNREEKFLAELLYSSLKDSDSDDKPVSTRESRLLKLGERFAGLDFKSKRKRQAAMVMLATLYANAQYIGPELSQDLQDVELGQLFNSEDPGLNIKLYAAHLATQIQLRNFEPVKRVWKKINSTSESDIEIASAINHWRGRRAYSKLEESAQNSMHHLLSESSHEQKLELIPVLTELTQPSYEKPLDVVTLVVTLLVTKQPDRVIELWTASDKRLEANGKPLTSRSGTSMNSFLKTINNRVTKMGLDDSTSRKNAVWSAWSLAKNYDYGFGSDKFLNGKANGNGTKYGLDYVAQLKLLTDEQLLELGPELAEIHSVNGEIWRQVAKRQFAAGKLKLAAESFGKALEQATEEMTQAKFNRRVEYANALVKVGKNEQAAELVKDIPVEQLFKSNKKILDELNKVLEEK